MCICIPDNNCALMVFEKRADSLMVEFVNWITKKFFVFTIVMQQEHFSLQFFNELTYELVVYENVVWARTNLPEVKKAVMRYFWGSINKICAFVDDARWFTSELQDTRHQILGSCLSNQNTFLGWSGIDYLVNFDTCWSDRNLNTSENALITRCIQISGDKIFHRSRRPWW